MEVNIETYRSRIGSFSTAGHSSYISTRTRKQSYNSRPRTFYKFRRLVFCILLLISILSRTETILKTETQLQTTQNLILSTSLLLQQILFPSSYLVVSSQQPFFLSFTSAILMSLVSTLLLLFMGFKLATLTEAGLSLLFPFNTLYCLIATSTQDTLMEIEQTGGLTK